MKLFIYILYLPVLLSTYYSNAQANITTKNADINIASGTSLIIPGDVKILGGSDYILNNGTCLIAGNFNNSGNSFNIPSATGTEIFNGNTTVSGSNSFFNNFTILPGATVTLSGSSIDILNNWTNNGLFVHGSKTVSFSGNVPVQYIIGSGTFYDLKLQNAVHFTSSKDTIENSFSNSATGMVDGTSLVVFNNNSSIIADKAKYFYDLEILGAANVTHTTGSTGSGNIHVAHSFVNNGSLIENPVYTFYFDSSNGSITMSGAGSTKFGNLTIGNAVLSFPTTVNTGISNFTIAGNNFTFNTKNSFLSSNGTVTFGLSTPGTAAIQNASGITGTSATFNNVNIDSAVSASPIPTAVNFGTGIAKINNNLTLNPGGSVTTNSPFYGNAATLIYNTKSPVLNTSLEWKNNTATPGGLGAPNNVSVQNDNVVLLSLSGSRTVPGILNLDVTGTLAINGNTLTINSGFTGAGALKGSTTSNLIAGGTGVINFVKYLPDNQLKILTINNAADLSLGGSSAAFDTLNIVAGNTTDGYGTVTVNGNGKLDANGILTLRSNSTGTARVGYSTGILYGNVMVERQVPARRAWRFLAVPFVLNSSMETIRDAWQEGVNNYCLDPLACNMNPNPGYGTHITGNNVSTDGFDFNTTTNPSMKVWDSTTNDWNVNEPHTISTNIASYRAYCLFVRGSRAVDLSQANYAVADSTVLRVKGILNQTGFTSTQNYLGISGQTIFVGNPYASSIDLSTALPRSSGIAGNIKFWVWDPKANGLYGVGKYVAYSNGIQAPNDTSYLYTAGNIIQSGQAFMVQLNNSNASVNFQESDKISSEINIFGKTVKKTYPAIYTNLLIPEDSSMSLTDGVTTAFGNQFSEKVDEDDAAKQWNFDENIALFRDNKFLAIEFRPTVTLTDTLFYRLYLRQQPYTLQIFTQNFKSMPLTRAWLIDKYLNTKTEVNLNDTTFYNFTPNPDTLSYRNRFMLVFNRQFAATPVPVTKITDQNNPNTAGVANSIAVKTPGVSIYPNPVSTSHAALQFNAMDKGSYATTIYNSKGEKLATYKLEHRGGDNVYSFLLNPSWASGLYTVNVTNKDSKKTINIKLVISK